VGFTTSVFGPWLAITAIVVFLVGANLWLLTEQARRLLVATPQ
jgi:hypothetical protein